VAPDRVGCAPDRAFATILGMSTRRLLQTLCALAVVALGSLPGRGRAADARRLGQPLDSVFYIAKSENRNQVHYAVRVDARCVPRGEQPVYGYWRNYEQGPTARSPLLSIEEPAYGLAAPQQRQRTAHGGSVRFALRAFPERTIVVDTFATPDGCRALAATRVHGEVAQLRSIYVQLGLLFAVERVLVHAERLSDGAQLVERVTN
jgi:hypothetical protein